MKIGYLSKYSPETVPFAKRCGLESVQLVQVPEITSRDYAETLDYYTAAVEDCRSHGLEVSALGCYKNFLDPDKETAEMNNHRLTTTIDLAADLAVNCVGTFAGRIPHLSIEENYPHFKTVFHQHVLHAEERGVRLALENCPGHSADPMKGYNIAIHPDAWAAIFEMIPSDYLGLEYDPSHLICMLIDPVEALCEFGGKVFHVHAKDAEICGHIVRRKGIQAPEAARHRMPGLGDADWGKIISALVEAGYRGNLNIEGRHDPVYHGEREAEGLNIARIHLQQFIPHIA